MDNIEEILGDLCDCTVIKDMHGLYEARVGVKPNDVYVVATTNRVLLVGEENNVRPLEERINGRFYVETRIIGSNLGNQLIEARKIQQSVIPKTNPVVGSYDIGAYMVPSEEVGGDSYDFIPLIQGYNSIGIGISDVVDKGLPAALNMMYAHALMRGYLSLKKVEDPGQVLLWQNLQILQFTDQLFITSILGVLDETGFRYARAGHELPVVVSQDGQIESIYNSVGQPIGMVIAPMLDRGYIELKKGQLFFMHTDGLPDETKSNREFYGKERLYKLVADNRFESAQDICKIVIDDVTKYRQGTKQNDDYTIVVIKS